LQGGRRHFGYDAHARRTSKGAEVTEPRRKDDRLFVRDGRRSHRRRYSRTEARWGIVVIAALGSLLAWVVWKGAHPDPSLFESGTLTETQLVVRDGDAPAGRDGMPSGDASDADVGAAAAPARAPFPAGLALTGWQEGPIAHYDSSNLYVKIDGREDYYKSFGFRRLHWVSLAASADPAVTVDIELFDMGTAANALGAYAGERPPEIAPQMDASGMWHRARNAAFATVGRYYARIVGADESPAVLAQLDHARTTLASALPGEPLPWGYALFVAGLDVDPGQVAYVTENAFSLGFARRVYTAKLDGDLEAFVVATVDDAAATALAARFVTGFRDYGEAAGRAHGLDWVQDRYMHTFATATAAGPWVVGVRGAADAARGAPAVERVKRAVAALAPDVVARARREAAADAPAAAVTTGAAAPAEPQY